MKFLCPLKWLFSGGMKLLTWSRQVESCLIGVRGLFALRRHRLVFIRTEKESAVGFLIWFQALESVIELHCGEMIQLIQTSASHMNLSAGISEYVFQKHSLKQRFCGTPRKVYKASNILIMILRKHHQLSFREWSRFKVVFRGESISTKAC